jgi:hypothetical protein
MARLKEDINKKALQDKGKSTEKGQEKGSLSNREEQVQSHIITERGPRFAPGNQVARGNKNVRISTETLLETLKEAEEAHKKPLMRHIWDVAYKDNKFLAKVLDKFIANKGIDISKFTGAGQFNVIINTYSNKDDTKTIDVTLENNDTPQDTQQEP